MKVRVISKAETKLQHTYILVMSRAFSARIQLELARLVGFSTRLSSARGIFGPARDLEMLPERAKSAL